MRLEVDNIYTREDKKLNKVKVAIFVILSVSLILFAATDYIMFEIAKHEKLAQNENKNMNNISGENIGENGEDLQENNEQDTNQGELTQYGPSRPQYIPVMTEKGIENINHIYRAEEDEKIAYLTFDDGPSSDVTPLILDLLAEENIKATFFVLGSQVERYPEIVKREYEEGHYIANHGYSHIYSKIYSSVDSLLNEYDETNRAIADALGIEGYETCLFRFPGGSVGGYDSVKKSAIEALTERNIAYLDWNSLTRDSEGKFTKEQLFQNLKNTVGSKKRLVILCHDAGGKILTYEVLSDIIEYLRDLGYEFGDIKNLVE